MSNDDFNIDNLLDGTLDDLADMPEFKPFTPGIHLCTLNIEQKVINNFPAFELSLKVKETQEVAPGAEPMAPGSETSTAYFMKHSNPKVAEMGQGQFKEILAKAAAHFGAKSNRELIADINGSEALVVTDLRPNKDKTKTYTNVKEVNFV